MPDQPTTAQSRLLSSKQTLNALQALRGCAAILVVCNHSIEIAQDKGGVISNPSLIAFANSLGNLGVSTFFVISGFVMMYAHGKDFGVKDAQARFANRRIGRIVPIYWLITLIYSAKLALDHAPPKIFAIIQSLLFFPFKDPIGGFGRPVLGQGWTLNYEVIFYLVFGLALFLRRGLSLVFLVFAAIVVLTALGALGRSATPLTFWGSPIVLFFLVGLTLGVLRQSFRGSFGFYGAIGLATIALGTCCIINANIWSFPLAVYCVSAISSIFAVSVCVLATEQSIDPISQTISKMLGAASYAIYLIHTLEISVIVKTINTHHVHVPLVLFVASMVLLTGATGIFVNMTVERWLTDRWSKLSNRWILQPSTYRLREFGKLHKKQIISASDAGNRD